MKLLFMSVLALILATPPAYAGDYTPQYGERFAWLLRVNNFPCERATLVVDYAFGGWMVNCEGDNRYLMWQEPYRTPAGEDRNRWQYKRR
jgi:hypothetical protein